jgi:hypothetical protein
MLRLAAFLSPIGLIVFAALVIGTLLSWMDGTYKGSLAQWLLHEAIQGALLTLSVWGAIRGWRRRQALPPAGRSRLGIGCLAVICVAVAVIMGFALMGGSKNREAANEAKAVVPPVIAALDRFKAEKKGYPTALDQLVPDYLPAVPGCKAGESQPRIAYWLEPVSGQYELACPASMLRRHRYRSATGEWDLSD